MPEGERLLSSQQAIIDVFAEQACHCRREKRYYRRKSMSSACHSSSPFAQLTALITTFVLFHHHLQTGPTAASGAIAHAGLLGSAPSSSPKLRYSKSQLMGSGDEQIVSIQGEPASKDNSSKADNLEASGSGARPPSSSGIPSSSPLMPTSPSRRTLRYNTAEFDLRSYLMTNYRMVRPVQRASDSLFVMSRLFPIKIQELVEKEERLVLTVRVQLGWVDQTMSWDPPQFYNQTSVVLPYDIKLWLPELQIVNSALDMYGIFSMRDRKSPVKAHSNGEIWWHPTGRMDVRCELQLMYFPFDFQRCGIVLEPVIYTQDQLNLTLRPDRSPVALSMYSENGLWDLVKTGGRQEVYWVSGATGFSRVEFVLYLQRRTTYYKMNIIFPCLLLSVLQLLTFILPIDNDERVPQATTILLSVIVFQTVIVDQLPKSSTSMSLLAMYISTLVGISTATVASSIICSLFISLKPSCFQVPPFFEPLVRRCVTRLPPSTSQPGEIIDHSTNHPLRYSKSIRRRRSFLANQQQASPTIVMKENKNASLLQQQQIELSEVNESVWQPNTSSSTLRRSSGHRYQEHHESSRNQSIDENKQEDSQHQSASRQPSKAPSVFSFHERCDYTNRSSPTTRSNHRSMSPSYITTPTSPLANQRSGGHNNTSGGNTVTVTATGEKMVTSCNSVSHTLYSNQPQQHLQQSPPAEAPHSQYQPNPKPPYVLVIDWSRMSHIINAAMFTLCLCLDVLVPSVLFYVMPPVNPPVD